MHVRERRTVLQGLTALFDVMMVACVVRAGARERMAGLPDSERRRAAARLALQLAAMLGEDEEEGEEGEEEPR